MILAVLLFHQIILLISYIGDKQYLKLTEYVNDTWDIESISDIDRIIYADALYQLGQYNQAIDNLNLLSESYPKDENISCLHYIIKRLEIKKIWLLY